MQQNKVKNIELSDNFVNVYKLTDKKMKIKQLSGLNREVNPSQVTILADSIKKMGILRAMILVNLSFIVGVPEWYILDGQHLYNACLREKLDVPYIIMDSSKITNKEELIEIIALLNASSKSWSTEDYLTAWGSVNPDYVRLRTLKGIYDMEIDQLAQLLHQGIITAKNCGGGKSIYKLLKQGKFSITNEQEALVILDYIKDALRTIGRMDRSSNKLFIACYTSFIQSHKDYNHKSFMTWLNTNKQTLTLATQDPNEISKILNKAIK